MEPLHPDDPRELGRYRLLRRIGEGGMGVVYLAVSTADDGHDLAAVKAVRREYAGDEEFWARFTGEVDLARRVRGPYTARVLDADTDGPTPWLATEYVPGPALNTAVRGSGPFPEESLLVLAAGLAEALSAIHAVGLIHRDLKPSNVLLASRGPQVIDFGIARATDATALTRTGQTLGTPAYTSPEQATGADLNARSDLFSFGGVLVFAATGRPPFGTGDPAALLYRVVNQSPDLSGLPDTLVPLVTACLAKDPHDRPDLDSVTAELTGTALPRGDDDATEWLPAAVATTIRHTLVAATRVVPTTAPPEADEPAWENQEPEESEGEDPGERGGPDEAAPEPAAPPPPEPLDVRGVPDQASPEPVEDAPGSAAALPDPAREAAERVVKSPEPGRDTDSSPSPAVFWTALVASVVSVVVLGMALDFSEGTTSQAETEPEVRETPESIPSAPASPSPAEDAPAFVRTRVEDTAFLDDERFVVLTTEGGLHVYDPNQTEPVDQLIALNEDYDFSYSELYVPPYGSMVAAMGDTASGGPVIHVWDLTRAPPARLRPGAVTSRRSSP
ncbi:protein kinase domain-containing protein [Nocardiopsis lucentensis]|uniref:protein kinase domain-containing protein n=1 Tax=Nocardiopsis lucentensis TaxID=53441 RepID=UPI00034DD1DA